MVRPIVSADRKYHRGSTKRKGQTRVKRYLTLFQTPNGGGFTGYGIHRSPADTPAGGNPVVAVITSTIALHDDSKEQPNVVWTHYEWQAIIHVVTELSYEHTQIPEDKSLAWCILEWAGGAGNLSGNELLTFEHKLNIHFTPMRY
jgi:hypothetical protein